MKRIAMFLAIWGGVCLALTGLITIVDVAHPAIVWLAVLTFMFALLIAVDMDI